MQVHLGGRAPHRFAVLRNALLVGLCLAIPVHASAQYRPPIGIPAPTFGIDQTVEAVYGSPLYYTYYVDNTSPNATDTSNPNGSPATPRLTLPRYLAAGDVVQVHGGPYTPSTDRFYFYGQGTSERPIFITGANAPTTPVFTKKVHFPDAQWLIFENIKLETTAGNAVEFRPLSNGVEIHHVAVRNSESAGSGQYKSGGSFSADNTTYDTPIHHVVFYNNLSHDTGQWDSPTEDDTSSFSIQHKVQYAWILDNVGFKSGGDGVILAHAANFTTHHIYIGRNTFYQHRENGIDLKQANDVVVSQNTLHSHRPTNSSAGECIVVHYNPTRLWFLFNKIYDCEHGVVITGATNVHLVGNVISNIRHTSTSYDPSSAYAAGAAIHARASDDINIVGNTLVDYDAGVQVPGDTLVSVFNNIFYGRAEPFGFDVLLANGSGAARSRFDFNLVRPVVAPVRLGWGSTAPRTLAEFQAAFSPNGSHSLDAEPMFVADATDLMLTSGSPAIDAGSLHSSYNLFQTYYGLSIATDIRGHQRPVNGAFDLGAYEYDAMSIAVPPSNLRILP